MLSILPVLQFAEVTSYELYELSLSVLQDSLVNRDLKQTEWKRFSREANYTDFSGIDEKETE